MKENRRGSQYHEHAKHLQKLIKNVQEIQSDEITHFGHSYIDWPYMGQRHDDEINNRLRMVAHQTNPNPKSLQLVIN